MNVSVVSGKGGAGKTFVSLHLASLLDNRGLLVDLDVEEPDDHLYIDDSRKDEIPSHILIPQINEELCTHCGACASVCQFHALVSIKGRILVMDALCHSCSACWKLCERGAITPIEKKIGVITTYQSSPIKLIEGKLDEGAISVVPLIKHAKKVAEKEKGAREFVIYDSPPGTSCSMVNSVSDSDLVIVVAEDTLFGLHDMILVLETLDHLHLPYIMVINKYNKENSVVSTYLQERNIEINATIPFNIKISKVYGQGKLVFNTLPQYRELFRPIIEHLESFKGEL